MKAICVNNSGLFKGLIEYEPHVSVQLDTSERQVLFLKMDRTRKEAYKLYQYEASFPRLNYTFFCSHDKLVKKYVREVRELKLKRILKDV